LKLMGSSLIIAGSLAETKSVLFATVASLIPRGDKFDYEEERLANMDINWVNSDYSRTPPSPFLT